MPSSATPSRDLDERIRELQLKITRAPPIRKPAYQAILADLIRQQQEQQQQQQQEENGGGKKHKKRSTKKRSTKKRSTKKRSTKKQSKSIKRKAGGG
jgi:hypothetical protein